MERLLSARTLVFIATGVCIYVVSLYVRSTRTTYTYVRVCETVELNGNAVSRKSVAWFYTYYRHM